MALVMLATCALCSIVRMGLGSTHLNGSEWSRSSRGPSPCSHAWWVALSKTFFTRPTNRPVSTLSG
eukprot:3876817-Pyramimonas_sp.AAC.1